MSSNASLAPNLEFKPAWGPTAALGAWVLLLIASIADCALPLALRLAAIAVVAVGAGFAWKRLPSRFVLRRDGTWLLVCSGVQVDGELIVPGRFISRCALLRWNSHLGRHWALVTERSGGPETFRRLRVRLRFS